MISDAIFAGAAKQLEEAAAIIRGRNAVYGDSVRPHAEAMAALYPNGITLKTPEDFARFSLVNMVIIKLTRYCANERGHRDSVIDSINYLGALAEIDQGTSG